MSLGSHTKRCLHVLSRIAVGAFLLTAFSTRAANVRADDSSSALLRRADIDRTTNFAEFGELLQRLDSRKSTLSVEEGHYLRFLLGWKAGYALDYGTANSLLQTVIADSKDSSLRMRAGFLMVNLYSNQARYEEASVLLSKLLDQLPMVVDPVVRARLLDSASEFYRQAGQYELAISFADQVIKDAPTKDTECVSRYVRIASLYKSGQLKGIEAQFDHGVKVCVEANDKLYVNGIYILIARLKLKQHQNDDAIFLLQKNYPDVQRLAFAPLTADYNVLLAKAYWDKNDAAMATQFALAAVRVMGDSQYNEPVSSAYEILYQISRQSGDMQQALSYHENYMAADKGYLNEVSARAMAFQIVNQQVMAKKLQFDTLNKQNQILELQQALGTKAVETSRLYILLLLTVLVSIGLWAYRLKRSQMSYMKLARRDGLTGIFNRQHFVDSAERQLKYCEKSGRVAGLIVIDLDNFKTVNDTFGHAAGDHILKRAVAACEGHLRSTDVFGRLGGEEFGILMPECDREMVAGRAEIIRAAIANISSEDDMAIVVSASFGVSSTTYSGFNLRQLLVHADKALYNAKHGGRNRVVVFAENESASADPFKVVPLSRR